MFILGISAFFHDSAACLIKDGKIVAACQEERFTRKKHDASFPSQAITACLNIGGITKSDIAMVAFYDKPFLKFERILETYLHYAHRGWMSFLKAMSVWMKKKLWIKSLIQDDLEYDNEIIFPEHHLSHAAAAFYPSPFENASILTMDGVGEWATASYGLGCANNLTILADIEFPHSLGMLYSAFTYYTGFKVNSGEYKVMGLAPYGEPKYVDDIKENLIDIKPDGSFFLNMDYFNYGSGLTMTSEKFHNLFDGPPRKPETELRQKDMDLAHSVQDVTEEIVLKSAKHIKKETRTNYLCLAGGVALNCVANGKLLRSNIFDDIWIQSAAGDAGGALGAALAAWHGYLDKPRKPDGKNDNMKGCFIGPQFSSDHQSFLDKVNAQYSKLSDEQLMETVAGFLESGKIIGWFQGRMEFGPRALGNRSIIGDARSPKMQETMNLKIKFRESFRPFAPSVLEEHVSEWFQLDQDSPYMLLVADVAKSIQKESDRENSAVGLEKLCLYRSEIPAVTHVDFSARIQTVHWETNPRYHTLINTFYKRTGCPVIVNTSFNVRGEPIVCTPKEAYSCFMHTEMDILVLENFVLLKDAQNVLKSERNYKNEFQLD